MTTPFADAHAVAVLANDALEIAVAELGGQIVSLRSRATDHEWLWKNSHLPRRTAPASPQDFGPYDTGGWDEVFPTVAPCIVPDSPWEDRMIADHGELWHRPWKLTGVATTSSGGSMTQVVDEYNLPFRFERKLTLAPSDGPLVVDYEVKNRSDAPLPFLWAAHPLFALAPGMTIRLPASLRMTKAYSQGVELAPGCENFLWPRATLIDGTAFDFSRVPTRDAGMAVKLFSEELVDGWASIATADGREEMRMSFSGKAVKYLALWLNYGAWSGAGTAPYFNYGFEPTTSSSESLAEAYEVNQAFVLGPRASLGWSLSLSLLVAQH
jgi:hypothetical protein